jgi:hypothetical protein
MIAGHVAPLILAVGVLAFMVLVTTVGGLRRRVPAFNAERALVRRGAYAGLLVGTLLLASVVDATRSAMPYAVRPALAHSCNVTVDQATISATYEWDGDAQDPRKVKVGEHTCTGDITWPDGSEGMYTLETCAGGNTSCRKDDDGGQSWDKAAKDLGPTTLQVTGTHWLATTRSPHCTIMVGDVVGNDKYDVEAVNDDCAVATSDAQAAASEIAQGMANGTMLQ